MLRINLRTYRTFGSLPNTKIASCSRRCISEPVNFVGWRGRHNLDLLAPDRPHARMDDDVLAGLRVIGVGEVAAAVGLVRLCPDHDQRGPGLSDSEGFHGALVCWCWPVYFFELATL